MTQKRMIFGRVGTKPIIKLVKNATKKICVFDVVEDLNGEEKPRWHKVVAWDKQADGCNLILDKGKEVFVHGRVIRKEFTKDSGEVNKYEEIHADKIGYVTLS